MGNISALIIVICGYSCIIGAMILTRYEKSSPVRVSGLTSCGVYASAFHYCAARVTAGTCDPLERDWCETKNMSDGGVYITKQIITEILQDTLVSGYDRPMPIYVSEDSELEFRFKLNSGWTIYAINLMDDSGDIVLHTKLGPNQFVFDTQVGGSWVKGEGYLNTFLFTDGQTYTLKIVCATVGFQIYLDGALEWTYSYHLPANTIRSIKISFDGADGDLYKVIYKAGP